MNSTMPELAPAYPLQWKCHASEGVEVAYEADEAAVRHAIAGKPFGYVSSAIIFYDGWMSKHDLGLTNACRFSMLSVPVRFNSEVGLWSLFMFVDDVPAILAGRRPRQERLKREGKSVNLSSATVPRLRKARPGGACSRMRGKCVNRAHRPSAARQKCPHHVPGFRGSDGAAFKSRSVSA